MNIYFKDQFGKLRQFFSPLFEDDGEEEINSMRNCTREVAISEGIIPKSAILALINCGK